MGCDGWIGERRLVMGCDGWMGSRRWVMGRGQSGRADGLGV